jgi:hypothetical protein
LRNNFVFELIGIMILLLNKFTSKNQLKPVFDLRLCPPINKVGYLSPLIANFEPLLKEVKIFHECPLALVDGRIESCKPSLSTLLAVSLGEGNLLLLSVTGHLEELTDIVEELLSNVGPVSWTLLHYQVSQNLVLLLRPFSLVASQLLNEEPSLLTLFGILCRHYFGNLFPVCFNQVLHILLVLHHECEQAVLE